MLIGVLIVAFPIYLDSTSTMSIIYTTTYMIYLVQIPRFLLYYYNNNMLHVLYK